MQDFGPYSLDELRRMRRLILTTGVSIEVWAQRLRRSADFLLSLSPGQAARLAEQAQAIGAQPDDLGPDEEFAHIHVEVSELSEGDRKTYVHKEIIAIRNRHYPDLPDEEE